MRCNTILCCFVHLEGTDLDLERLSVRPDQCSMQRLVHVWLRHGNIVLETSRNRFIHLVNHTKCRITVLDCINKDTNCKQIIDLIDRLVLIDHLFIDAEEMFDTSVNLCFDRSFVHMLLDLFDNIVYKFLTFTLSQSHFIYKIIVYIRFQIFQGEIIQFDFDLGNTEAHRNRRINIHRLACFFLLFFRSHILQGTHVVKSVCKLDQNNTDILCHRKEHLTKIFCLQFHFIC